MSGIPLHRFSHMLETLREQEAQATYEYRRIMIGYQRGNNAHIKKPVPPELLIKKAQSKK